MKRNEILFHLNYMFSFIAYSNVLFSEFLFVFWFSVQIDRMFRHLLLFESEVIDDDDGADALKTRVIEEISRKQKQK